MVSTFNTKPLIATLLAGFFSEKMESVNLINSEVIAKEKNIDVVASYQEKGINYESEIFIEVDLASRR